MSAVALLATLCGGGRRILADTVDLSRTAALSFTYSRQVVLLDGGSGESVGTVALGGVPRDLAVAGDGWLFAAEESRTESVNLAVPGETYRLRLPRVDHVLAGVGLRRAYASRASPSGVLGVTLGAAGTVDWTTRLPARVRALALDASGRALFVGYGWRPGRIAMVDAMTGSIGRTLTLDKAPAALALGGDGSTLYALGWGDGVLSAIAVADGITRTAVRLSAGARALAVSQDGTRVYVADPTKSVLTVVDGTSLSVVGTVALPAQPYDVALTPDGTRLIVASSRARAVFLVDTATLQVVRTRTFRQRPRRVVVAGGAPKPLTTPTPAATVPLPSPTPMPTATATAAQDQLSTPTASATDTASATATPMPPSTPAPTSTPSPSLGVMVGQVFDDATAQPLAAVRIEVAGAVVASTNANGRYAWSPSAPGEAVLELTKSGYSRAVRRAGVAGADRLQLQDARLTPLTLPVTVRDEAGVVGAPYKAPGLAGTIELRFPAGDLPVGASVGLTALSPQGLIAPVPLGWSVLLGVDLSLGAASRWPERVSLGVPLALLSPAASLPVTVAVWDDAAVQWRNGPPAASVGDQLEVELVGMAATTQLALLVADSLPAKPPTPVQGEMLRGVDPLPPTPGAALVTAVPAAIVAGGGAGAQVLVEMEGLPQPPPSGTLLTVQLHEEYELQEGQPVAGMVSNQDIVGYQLSPGLAPFPAPTSLDAYFNLTPSRTFTIGELKQGRVAIDLALPQGAPHPGTVGPSGGAVTGAGGLRLIVPPEAAGQGTVVGLRPVAAAALPNGAGNRLDLIGAFALEVDGGVLSPTATYQVDLGLPVPDGLEVAIAEVTTLNQRSEMVLTSFGRGQNGLVVMQACTATASICLAGLAGSGTYAVFALPSGAAIVTGTVTDSAGACADLLVEADAAAVAGVTDSAGRYVLPVPAGATSTVSCFDRARDLRGSVAVTPSPSEVMTADIILRPTVPEVVRIDPANHASQVPADAAVAITFSEPIAPASVTGASAQLLRADARPASTPHGVATRLSLSADRTHLLLTPAEPLAPNTVYRIILTGDITDLHGNRLAGAFADPLAGFSSDFTTAAIFEAEALPANTLRVSLPDEQGRVFVCGGAQLAAPGTAVTVGNTVGGVTVSGLATDSAGRSGSDTCDYLFPGRCDTTQPGSFCVVIDAAPGDRIQVEAEDVLQNTVVVDAGNMRDERTGATAVGSEGGRVSAAEDSRYSADIPSGAFDAVQIVTLVPVRDDEFPIPPDASSGLHRLGALLLDFGDEKITAAQELRLTIPAPVGFDPAAQVLVGHVVNFRGGSELTMVETASFGADASGQGVLTTNSPPFPGVTHAGHYDFSTPDRSVGYVMGVVDKHHSTIEVLPTMLTFVFPFVDPALTKFVMPVIANAPFAVTLTDVLGAQLDAVTIQGPPPGEIVDIGTLSDDGTDPSVDGFDIPANQVDVTDDVHPVIAFNRPVRSIGGRLAAGAIAVGGPAGVIEGVWVVVSADGRKVQFFPRRPLPPGVTISVAIVDVRDFRGRAFPPFQTTFTTYRPERVAGLPIPSNDLDVLQHVEHGVPLPYAVVAHDDGSETDWEHGLVSVDLRNPRSPRIVGEVVTPGVDRAVRVVSHEPPLVASIDGAGNAQRFGTLRAFDFSDPGHPTEVGRRVLNLSPETIQQQIFFLDGVPNDGGVPESLAALGTDVLYVANPPTLGIQGVTLGRMIPPRNEIEGTFRGGYRAVTTLGAYVVAGGPGMGQDEMVVLSADLRAVLSRQLMSAPVLGLLGVPAYPVDVDGDGNLGQAEDEDGDATTAAEEALDLVLVLSNAPRVDVFQVAGAGELRPMGSVALPVEIGRTQGAAVDAQHRRLYLAGGTAGLVIADFDDPMRPPSSGNAVLDVIPLPGTARKVRLLTDARGIRYAVLACDHSVEVVQLSPEEAGLTIYDANNSSVVEEAFEESEGTFILANNDNDDASADAAGRPVQDRDKAGRVEGENDLRRLDIAAPMGEGVLVLDMPSGADHARVWLSNEREGPVGFPQRYDLGAGERPPRTMWIEGVAPSGSDRDVRITYRWEAPAGSGLDPIADTVTATVVELDFIPGRHGAGEPGSNWLGDRKTTFLQTDVEDLEGVISGDAGVNDLGQGQFGAMRVRGLDPSKVRAVTVRATDEVTRHGWEARVADETAPADLQIVSTGARAFSAVQDVLVYAGSVRTPADGSTLTAAAVRDALRPGGVVPLRSTQAALPAGTVQIAIDIESARGTIPALVGGDAGVAVLEVIDAQAFAEPISTGVRGSALREAYQGFDGAAGAQFTHMQGALADRWSRLILRLTLPALDPHTAFDFSLGTDPPDVEPLLRSNHTGDAQFPFGMLSRTGFDGFSADESAPEQVTPDGPTAAMHAVPVTRSGRCRAVTVVYTPPGSFPYRNDDSQPHLTEGLAVDVQSTDEGTLWARAKLLLVRPPVMFVHGLMGDRNAFGQKFVQQFFSSFISFFVDYGPDSVSGFDRIFSAVPREIGVELRRLREGDHSRGSDPRRFEIGQAIEGLQRKRIAATKADAIAHSMGGLAVRWYATDSLSAISSQPRQIRYPASSGLATITGVRFPPIRTQRAATDRYKRFGNFQRGDLRNVVTTGSPQLGSPIGSYVTHEVCGDDREFFIDPLTADTLFYWLGQIHFAPGGVSQSADLGTAIADLAIGSSALGLLQSNPSDAVAVHAIAATDAGGDVEYRLAVFGLRLGATLKRASDLGLGRWLIGQLGLGSVLYPALFASTPTPELYCPGFGPTTGDLVVPEVSARYGTQHYTGVSPFNHLDVNQDPKIAKHISERLLLDSATDSRVDEFDPAFPTGQPWPLMCQ